MPTILLELSGPMQSWGASSKFDTRLSESFPTKSGVIGMIANAMGRTREEDISDLASVKFGVRIDRPGKMMVDYHTAHGEKQTSAYVTLRHYLNDAKFIVGIESDDRELLLKIENALKNPKRPLYLGRKSCPITVPPFKKLSENGLEATLRSEYLPEPSWREQRLEIWVEGDSKYRHRKIKDSPVSFNPNRTRHKDRYIYQDDPVIIPSVFRGSLDEEVDFFS